jgi:YHS domain-containing protein
MAKFWTQIFTNTWRQPTKRNNLNFDQYLPYFDGNDNFPLKWHKAISESPSASSCVSTIQDFLEGFGFSDPQLEKRIVNTKNETVFQVHSKTCKDFGEFEGFCWLFRFDGSGNISEWEHLPFENCRLSKPDDRGFIPFILYNPFFGTSDYSSEKSKFTTPYHTYNPAAVNEQILKEKSKFKGQVFFFGTTTALSRFYPMPEAYSSVKWMGVETGVSDYHEDNINNGFLQPYILCMIGNPDEPITNPEGSSDKKPITRAEEFDNLVSANFMGAKRVGNHMIHWVSSKEEAPFPVPLPTNSSGDLFLAVDTQATKKITIAFKVPAILANINEGVSLGGDGNMIRVAVKLMQQRVIKKQRMLTDAYGMVLKKFATPYVQEITITPYNPYPELEVLDDKVWNAISREEQRDWIEKNTEIELIDPIGTPPVTNGQQIAAKYTNTIPMAFPEKVRAKIKKALEYQDKMGIKCSSTGGRMISEAILNNQNLGMRNLKRIYSYLKKRPEFENSLYSEGCNAIAYHSWGGKDMEDFLESKLKEVDAWLN